MIIAVATLSIVVNTFFASTLPMIENLMLMIHVFGFFAILIPLWVLSPTQPAEKVFTHFTDAYGWPSQGLACLVGIVGPMYSLLGPDSAVHMCRCRHFDYDDDANNVQLKRSAMPLASSLRP